MKKLLIVLLLLTLELEICSAQSTTTYSQIPEYCNSGISNRTREQNIACLRAMAVAEGYTVPPVQLVDWSLVQPDSKYLEVIYQPDVDAYYPSFSKRAGEEGTAICRIFFGKDGTVTETILLKSAGYSRLDRATLEVCKRIQIKPFIVNNEPTLIRTDYSIRFKLIK
jgi:TonB family protein